MYSSHQTNPFIEQRLDEIVATFGKYRKTGRLLDIGFGAGDLLRAARRAGWLAEGVELSASAVHHAQAQGFTVYQGDLAQIDLQAEAYDVVTASEVLEHLADPLPYCRVVARILRPGGLFWATTPHGRGLSGRVLGLRWTVCDPREHLQLFSPRGAEILLQEAGFRAVDGRTQGVNPMEILVEIRRRIGRPPRDFSRNESSQNLNAFLSESPGKKLLKEAANSILAATRLGDSLKLRAER